MSKESANCTMRDGCDRTQIKKFNRDLFRATSDERVKVGSLQWLVNLRKSVTVGDSARTWAKWAIIECPTKDGQAFGLYDTIVIRAKDGSCVYVYAVSDESRNLVLHKPVTARGDTKQSHTISDLDSLLEGL